MLRQSVATAVGADAWHLAMAAWMVGANLALFASLGQIAHPLLDRCPVPEGPVLVLQPRHLFLRLGEGPSVTSSSPRRTFTVVASLAGRRRLPYRVDPPADGLVEPGLERGLGCFVPRLCRGQIVVDHVDQHVLHRRYPLNVGQGGPGHAGLDPRTVRPA